MDYVLTHHGILGMKWGKRNGPPYPLTGSKRRKIKSDDADMKKNEKKDSRSFSTSVKTMSDEELKTAISRLELERQYKTLLQPEAKAQIFNGRKFISHVLETTGTSLAIQASHYLGAQLLNKIPHDKKKYPEIVSPKDIKK